MRPVSRAGLLAEVTLSSPALASCGICSATTSCLLSCPTPFIPAWGLAFALLSLACSSLFRVSLFFPPSIIHVSLQAASQRGSLSNVSGLLTSPVALTFLFLNCCPPTTLHVCVCVSVCTAAWPPPHGAVQCKYVWMTTSPAPSFLSVYNFKKIYLQKYDGHFITFISSTMDKERS